MHAKFTVSVVTRLITSPKMENVRIMILPACEPLNGSHGWPTNTKPKTYGRGSGSSQNDNETAESHTLYCTSTTTIASDFPAHKTKQSLLSLEGPAMRNHACIVKCNHDLWSKLTTLGTPMNPRMKVMM